MGRGTSTWGCKIAADDITIEDLNEDEEDEPLWQSQNDLVHEIIVLERLGYEAPILRVPQVLDSGTNFFIMTRLEETVEKLHEDVGWEFSNAEIMFISLQVYEIMINLHNVGHVHGDIREGNVARGFGADKDNFYLIDFGRADGRFHGVSTASNDRGAFLDMMVRLFRGSSAGLVPEHDEDDNISWCNLSDEMKQQMKKNVDDAVEAREKQGMPIPNPIKVLLQESIERLPSYQRMTALMRKAYVETIDPNEGLFEGY
ncbi:Protein kinase [Gracilaria domingensis]|nr:Protein kinase [Gracilaria domingensis]